MPSSSIVYNDIWFVPNKHVIAIFYITSLISSQPHISTLKIYVCLYVYLHILCIIYTHIYTYIYIIYIYIYINAKCIYT